MSIYLSASYIRDALTCSMLGKHRRYNKDKSVETEEIKIGTIVHESIEHHSDSLENALNLARNHQKWYNITDKSRILVERYVQSFFDNFAGSLGEDDTIEKFFKFKYSDGVYIVGKIDRISQGHVIWDWKTTKRPPTDISKDPQFMLYHEAYYQDYGVYPSAVLYGALATGRAIAYKPDEKYKKILFEQYIPILIERIRREEFTYEGMLKWDFPCNRCLYKDFCFEQLERENELDSRIAFIG